MQLFARNNLWIRRLLVLATRWLIAVFTQTLCSQCAPVLPHNSTWHQSRSCSHGNKRHKKISGNRYKTQNQGSYIKSQVRVIYVIQNKSVTLNGTIYNQSRQWSEISMGQYIFFCKQNLKILYSCKKLNPRSALFIKKSIYPVAQFDNKNMRMTQSTKLRATLVYKPKVRPIIMILLIIQI